MSEDNASSENIQANMSEDNTSPVLDTDGIGLDFDCMKKVLSEALGYPVGNNDPILMVGALLNSFLGEVQKVHEIHENASKAVMGKQTAKYIDAVKNTTDQLGEFLKNASVAAIRDIFEKHNLALEKQTLNSRWCAGIIAISALLDAAVYFIVR
ncbi:MAG: hypothetical protein LBP22_00545 [Deltaproteobacteria bacterium]|jgi:hypothetical protein|nr:hypothetical protein [Deltaproteobacteria bacterium]